LSKHHKINISKSHFPSLRSVVAYAGVFTVLISAVGFSYHLPDGSNVSTILTTPVNAAQDSTSVDEVTALQVAGNIAKHADLPVAANIANLSISLDAANKVSQNDDNPIISKPQIIAPAADSLSIKKYVTKVGDTPQSIAEQFQVSAQTIKWANNLSTDTVEPNTELTIPLVDGVIYTVKAADTTDSIASKYKSDVAQIISFNDLELSGIKNGQQLILPGGELPVEEQPGYIAPAPLTAAATSSASVSSATSRLVGGYSPISAVASGNAYAFGNCTSWAYERRAQLGHPVGSYWGNAATWDSFGRASGYVVDKTATVGAVFQMPAFIDAYTGAYGHVGVVEAVNPDGSVYVSEMNYAGNFNRVTYRTIPAGQAALYNYIH
jgi:surface antigen